MKFNIIFNGENFQIAYPLTIAIKHQNLEMVKLLLSHGANVYNQVIEHKEYQDRLDYIYRWDLTDDPPEIPFLNMIDYAEIYGTPEILALVESKKKEDSDYS